MLSTFFYKLDISVLCYIYSLSNSSILGYYVTDRNMEPPLCTKTPLEYITQKLYWLSLGENNIKL